MHSSLRRQQICHCTYAALLMACWLPHIARAEPAVPREFAVTAQALPLPAVVSRLPAVAARTAFGGALGNEQLDDEQLGRLRGGTDTPWSDMRLNGTVGNNAATNVTTGSNIISDGAFSNASGLPMVIQNSGANVLIQNATIVNVQFQ